MFTKDVGHFEPLARISVLASPPASNIHPITGIANRVWTLADLLA
jgi:hypothetical protein